MPEPLAIAFGDAPRASAPHSAPGARASDNATGLIGSEILKIAADIRAAVARGDKVTNLTVGDFSPARVPHSRGARGAHRRRVRRRRDELPAVRRRARAARGGARASTRGTSGSTTRCRSVLIAGGGAAAHLRCLPRARRPGRPRRLPRAVVEQQSLRAPAGRRSACPSCAARTPNFLPTRALLAPVHPGRAAGRAVLAAQPDRHAVRRRGAGRHLRPRARGERAARPRRAAALRALRPDLLDAHLRRGASPHAGRRSARDRAATPCSSTAISKAFAATGVRVGWAVGPPDVIDRMAAILGHVGAWAPRPEQVAVAGFLDDADGCATYLTDMRAGVEARLDRAPRRSRRAQGAQGFRSTRSLLARPSTSPCTSIFLVRARPTGARWPTARTFASTCSMRRAWRSCPSPAFGATDESGWCRLSVGAVSIADLDALLPRLEGALRALQASGDGASLTGGAR